MESEFWTNQQPGKSGLVRVTFGPPGPGTDLDWGSRQASRNLDSRHDQFHAVLDSTEVQYAPADLDLVEVRIELVGFRAVRW